MVEGHSRLSGKVALVTGAGASGPGPRVGTGKAISMRFAREGARILLVDREADKARDTLAAIEEEGGTASVFEGDVTSAADCQAIADAARERYGGLHILVNNVGIITPGPATVVSVPEEEWDLVLDVNLKGMMLTSKYAIPRMTESGGGSIINISSTGGMRGSRYGQVHYNTSKGAVITLTTTMAAQHGRDKVRVNCIAPGNISTPMVGRIQSDEELARITEASPLGIEGTAWDIAWAAVFLASDEARWITGVVLPVDAGSLTTGAGGAVPRGQ